MNTKDIENIALYLIDKLLDARYEYLDSPDTMKMTIGEIIGIMEMVKAMKEEVKK